MKKIILTAFSVVVSLLCCSQEFTIDASRADSLPAPKKDVLVAYFSATGRTKAVAEDLAKAADADLWEIVPLIPYTDADLDWRNPESRSSLEMKDPMERPTIKMCTDISSYKVIFLGFPIWWGVCPRMINSWIDNNDLTGKKLIPFATSGSSQISGAVEYLRKTYPQYEWSDGQLFKSYPEGYMELWSKQILNTK